MKQFFTIVASKPKQGATMYMARCTVQMAQYGDVVFCHSCWDSERLEKLFIKIKHSGAAPDASLSKIHLMRTCGLASPDALAAMIKDEEKITGRKFSFISVDSLEESVVFKSENAPYSERTAALRRLSRFFPNSDLDVGVQCIQNGDVPLWAVEALPDRIVETVGTATDRDSETMCVKTVERRSGYRKLESVFRIW